MPQLTSTSSFTVRFDRNRQARCRLLGNVDRPERFTLKKQFTDLDGMRGMLACVVMAFHFGLNGILQKLSGGIIEGGVWELCVDFFFVLSGFVMGQSFALRRPTLVEYANRRIRRLVPLYLFSMALILLVSTEIFAISELIANVLLVQSFLSLLSINFPSWSIPFELYLPAVAAIAFGMFQGRTGQAVLAVALILGSIVLVVLAYGQDLPLFRAISGLSAGFALYAMREVFPARPQPAIVLGLFLLTPVLMIAAHHLPPLAVLFLPLCCLLVLMGSHTETVLSSAPVQALGKWSYGIYLLHIPMLMAGERLFSQQAMSGLVPKIGLVTLTIVFAAIAHELIEKPFFRRRSGALKTASAP